MAVPLLTASPIRSRILRHVWGPGEVESKMDRKCFLGSTNGFRLESFFFGKYSLESKIFRGSFPFSRITCSSHSPDMRTQSMHIDEQQLPKELSFPASAAKILMLRPSVSSFAPTVRSPHAKEVRCDSSLTFWRGC
ncbi:hypothetical protein CDAR_374021 [Caerostris darwini]|uniref:Uncharacterized protein n=1 Tax=Caerostris darwini TaxID=1538125 RepID=A0AAV4PT76_9ARAC|nr:hypothetical protein CDAR_264251 [Caerostris darwini]GIY01587.1 hypothetical protein CDAR_374021 [Caerostris darwini]